MGGTIPHYATWYIVPHFSEAATNRRPPDKRKHWSFRIREVGIYLWTNSESKTGISTEKRIIKQNSDKYMEIGKLNLKKGGIFIDTWMTWNWSLEMKLESMEKKNVGGGRKTWKLIQEFSFFFYSSSLVKMGTLWEAGLLKIVLPVVESDCGVGTSVSSLYEIGVWLLK